MDRRKRKTQKGIIEAFTTLLIKKEFDEISVSEISEKADISRGTFYLNFLDKNDLLERCVSDQVDALANYCKEQTAESESSTALRTTFDYINDHKKKLKKLFLADNQGFFKKYLTGYIVEVLADVNQEADDDLTHLFIANGILGLLEYFLTIPDVSTDKVVESLEQITRKLA